ncbi:carboxypeptidase regulatory-like domain-containing protein [Candidatus Dojkabacteria bacterium]|uniref:Carboxypeptidase regulatory-like domain-containing protein n=1 Tax=Candidatus Dojkabacteria bacterium TaxID=2099670 RepID=A0A955RM41_9BACT|nr:carboxypeptidase regulatory-like domain-containing protein [Candidatus Dojkabacteria bacterium]
MNRLRDKSTLTLLIIASLFIVCIFSSLVIYFAKADLLVFSYSVSGVVSDQSSVSIPDAEITLNNEVLSKSNVDGSYTISNLDEGRYEFIVKRDGYVDRTVTIDIKRSFFKYNFKRNITLSNAANAGLTGKFITNDPSYKFVDDRITINDDQSYNINDDGTFQLEKIPSGEITFKFKSKNFKDINEKITLSPDTNTLADIELTPAGDIEETLNSYVIESIVSDINVTGESIEQNNVLVDENKLFINDLDVNKTYKIRISASGYETREYELNISQGTNKLPNFKLVEEGQALFRAKFDKNFQFYQADFDGADLSQLINTDTESKSFYYNSNENAVYIASEQDRLNGILGARIPLIYLFDLNTNSFQKITTLTEGLGAIFPQYKAQKIVNITSDDRRSSKRIVEIRDFVGNITKPVETTVGIDYINVKLSSDSKYLATLTQSSDDSTSLNFINLDLNKKNVISSADNLELYEISESGKRVLFSANRSSQNFTDLLIYDRDTNEIRTLLVDERGSDYQFYMGSDDLIIYWDTIQGQTDVFMFNIENNKNTKLTNLSALDSIKKIYQQSDYLFYITNRGLYIMDINNPKSNKLVLNGEFIY